MGSLYEELDDAIKTAERNLAILKDMAATLLEYSESNDVTMGRVSGIARYIGATPIIPVQSQPVPEPTVADRLSQAQANAGPAQPKKWGQILQEINANDGIPQGTVKRTVAA